MAASFPSAIYATSFPCSCRSTVFRFFTGKTALYSVVLTWQLPPPRAWTVSPFIITSASWYPLLVVDLPIVEQNENVLPTGTIVLFNVSHVIFILFWRPLALLFIGVENEDISESTYTGCFWGGTSDSSVVVFSFNISLDIFCEFVSLPTGCYNRCIKIFVWSFLSSIIIIGIFIIWKEIPTCG